MKQHKEKLRKKKPTYTAPKIVRYLRIHLTKEEKGLYSENYKTLMKETEDDTKKWKYIPSSWIGRRNTVKMTILPKAIYAFNAIPINIFHRPRTKSSKICMEPQKNLKSQSNHKKEKQSWRHFKNQITRHNFKLYYKVAVIKT